MTDERTMNSADIARVSNEWMRRYIEEPEKFEREFQTVTRFLSDTVIGKVPDYGDECRAYMFHLLDEMRGEL